MTFVRTALLVLSLAGLPLLGCEDPNAAGPIVDRSDDDHAHGPDTHTHDEPAAANDAHGSDTHSHEEPTGDDHEHGPDTHTHDD